MAVAVMPEREHAEPQGEADRGPRLPDASLSGAMSSVTEGGSFLRPSV